MSRILWIVSLVLLASAARVAAQPSSDPCARIVGEWNWFTQARILINADGSLLVKNNTPNAGTSAVGKWRCDAGSGQYTLTWTNNAVDTLALTHDGDVLSGKNQLGFEVTAERIVPEPVAQPAPAVRAPPRPAPQPASNNCAPGSAGNWRQQCTNELKASPLYGPFPSQGEINNCIQQKMAACGNLVP